MNTSHIVSLVLALFAALLVIVAGRSCAKSAERANRESSAKKISTTKPKSDEEQYTQFQQNIEDQLLSASQSAPVTTEIPYETVTNIFGEVVETIPVTEAAKENAEADANAPTTTLSILDEYNLSIGEDIYEDDVKNNEKDFSTTIYIEPETNITIYVE